MNKLYLLYGVTGLVFSEILFETESWQDNFSYKKIIKVYFSEWNNALYAK